MLPPADPAVAFGPARIIGPQGLAMARAEYGGRALRGEFLAGAAVRSDCRRFLVLSRFQAIRTRGNVLLLLLALLPWVVALGTDWWPWLRTEPGSLLMGLSMAVVLGVGFVLLWQLGARLRGRRLGGSRPFQLVLIDEDTGHVYAQRGGEKLIIPLRLGRLPSMRMPLRTSRSLRRFGRSRQIYYQAGHPDEVRSLAVETRTFRQLRPAEAFC